MASDGSLSAPSAGIPRWVFLGAFLLPLLYLPTLATRFDFIDDGNLVYPMRDLSPGQRVGAVWDKVVANYEHLGPFRPVLWSHWEVFAEVTQGSDVGWRVVRLLWCGLATFMLLWLLAELRIAPVAALFAAALAMWNPYRNEIWTSLTLSEGVAMPYAMLALICARRAGRSPRPLFWDIIGACSVLAALGCKNTFAALIPAQVFLRMLPDEMPIREAWRVHGRRALVLGLTLLAPIAHYIYFKMHWHPGQYDTAGPAAGQLRRYFFGLTGAVSLEYIGLGLLLALAVQVARRWEWFADFFQRYRAALGAGLLLVMAGTVLYLPIPSMSGRYTMPAVWGLDLALAAVLSGFAALPITAGRRVVWAALLVGLVCVSASSVGKQMKFAARARLLWDTLEWVEQNAPPNARVAWLSGDSLKGELNVEEGIHFQWHLAARGRGDVRVGLYDTAGKPLPRCELPAPDAEPTFALWGRPSSVHADEWEVRHKFASVYWAGRKEFDCFLGRRRPGGPPLLAGMGHP